MVRIGTAHEFFRERIAPHLVSYPVRVIVHYGIASAILDLLLEEKVDIIVTSQKLSAPGVEYIHYGQEAFVVVAPNDFPEPDCIDLEQLEAWLCSQPWISYGLELPIIRRFWRTHFQKRPQMQLKHVLPDLPVILRAIEHGAGISILPTYMLKSALKTGTAKVLCQPYTVSNDLYLGYLIKNRNLPNLKAVIDSLNKKSLS